MTIHLGVMLPCRSSDRPEGKAGYPMPLLFDLAPSGVCQAAQLPVRWCALTAPFQPYRKSGGSFSVALSLRSPSPGVTRHPALWSSDFPQTLRLRSYGLLANLSSASRGPQKILIGIGIHADIGLLTLHVRADFLGTLNAPVCSRHCFQTFLGYESAACVASDSFHHPSPSETIYAEYQSAYHVYFLEQIDNSFRWKT